MSVAPPPARLFDPLQFRTVQGWGRIRGSVAHVVEAHSEAQVRDVVLAARAEGRTIMSRGSGFSYGDPALNGGNLVLDLRPMNRVITWDEERGIIDLEPGVTVGDLCRHVASAGWWPPVLPGTQGPTMGGCAAANVHGKNNWKLGTFGEHVLELDVTLADGTTVICGPRKDRDLFVAVLGGFGLLGVITRIRVQMQPGVGELHVEQYAAPELEDVMAIFERWTGRADYMVGWIDGFASGQSLGRGLVQVADIMESGRSAASMDRPTSRLSESLRSHGHLALRPFATRPALRAAAAAQYTWGALHNGRGEYITRERFHFFHDAIPNWNRAFPSGVIQYQMFVPIDSAASVFRAALETSHEAGLPPFLAVLKRHRPDSFLLSEGVDGFSLSLDYHPGQAGRVNLEAALARLTDDVVLPAGGRFYLAKDSVLTPEQMHRSFGNDAVDGFLSLKRRLDPGEIFQSDMYRRLFVSFAAGL